MTNETTDEMTKQHSSEQHGGLQHGGVQHGGVQHGGVQHGGVQHGGVQHDGVQHGGDQAKPTIESLGIDLAAQCWRRSGTGAGSIEVAMVGAAPAADGAVVSEWVLMRVCGDADARVLVYDRNEWECFLDGVRRGEFDLAPG